MAKSKEVIHVEGVREHNLRNLTLDIPRGKFIAVTGVSGSGKSTLAFNVLFSEGQRRFLDSMSAYARQFVEQLPRAELDLIEGIPPSVSIEQRSTRGGGKSTVATLTEIYHFLRLLYSRLGIQYCESCDIPITGSDRAVVTDQARRDLRKVRKGEIVCLAPISHGRKGTHVDLLNGLVKKGCSQARIDGQYYDLSTIPQLARYKAHDIDAVLFKGALAQKELEKTFDDALELGNGVFYLVFPDAKEKIYSAHRSCPKCGTSYPLLDPYDFSFNSPRGWCPACRGFGEVFDIPDVERGARAEDIEESWFNWLEDEREICPQCRGSRLKSMSRHVHLPGEWFGREKGPSIVELAAMNTEEALKTFSGITVKDSFAQDIVQDIFLEIVSRLSFLNQVGLDYLCLDRGIPTLSGGETQRIRLAAQLGSTLSGVLYVLDEPTIGLHARDNEQLIDTLRKLRSRDNTLVVVEHDEETIRAADHIIDMGPGAGVHGGQVVFQGSFAQLQKCGKSLTAQCFFEKYHYPARGERRPVVPAGKSIPQEWFTLKNASLHNLKEVTVRFPLNRFIVVTGVSGSGKSSLVRGCLYPALKQYIAAHPGGKGKEGPVLRAVYEVDQSPIGRTPRSVPATYVGFFDTIRKIFAQTTEAKLKGFQASRFSFNSSSGRCPACEGAGLIKFSMSFMPPAYVTCDTCGGSRFNPETLDVHFQGKTIDEVLQMSVAEAIDFFKNHSAILKPLRALADTGLDYMKLGQGSPTLSGGEAQRVKLVTYLLGGLNSAEDTRFRSGQNNFFILEEPTIGLHSSDVRRLVSVIQRLVDAGNTVLVIEHNYDLIAEADWVIDLGPEGGTEGGRVVAEGTPEQISETPTWTGKYLKKYFSVHREK